MFYDEPPFGGGDARQRGFMEMYYRELRKKQAFELDVIEWVPAATIGFIVLLLWSFVCIVPTIFGYMTVGQMAAAIGMAALLIAIAVAALVGAWQLLKLLAYTPGALLRALRGRSG